MRLKHYLFPVAVYLLVLSLVQGAFEASQAQPVICEGERARAKLEMPGDLLRLEHANPYDDFKQDMKTGDLRFIGLWGLKLNFPGIEDAGLYQEIRNGTYDSWNVQGTSDVVNGSRHWKLISIAGRYAWIYNTLLAKHLNKPFVPVRAPYPVCQEGNIVLEKDYTGIPVTGLDSVEASDADLDLCNAISKGDFRLIGARDGSLCVPQALHALRLYGSQLRTIIDFNASSAPRGSYEFKRRRLTGRLYVETYNRVLEVYMGMETSRVMMVLEGFENIQDRFTLRQPPGRPAYGHFAAALSRKVRTDAPVDEATWHMALQDGRLAYDWNDFLETFNTANETLRKSTWLREIRDEGTVQAVRLDIDGITPHVDDADFSRAREIWKKEHLDSEPYYALSMFVITGERSRAELSGYISKNGELVLINGDLLTDLSTGKVTLDSQHWIFQKVPAIKVRPFIIIDNRARTYYRSSDSSDKPAEKKRF